MVYDYGIGSQGRRTPSLSNLMTITIEISNDSKIVAKSVIENNESFWAMHIDEENEPYDEYLTCDVFNLIKEEIAPIQN